MTKTLSKRELRKLVTYIEKNYSEEKMEFREYLFSSLDNFVELFNKEYNEEQLLERLYDFDGYEKCVKIFNEHIEKYKAPRVKIYKKTGTEYIELTNFGTRVASNDRAWLLGQLEELDNLDSKGDKYEKFCECFLKDIGFNAETTRSSGDSGIDVIGRISFTFEKESLKDIFGNSGIHIISQAKYHTKPIDKSIIKNMIGDSIFYRFNPKEFIVIDNRDKEINIKMNNHPAYLCVFSHNGFTGSAKKFAKKHGVITLNSNQMTNLLCSLDDFEELKSIKFLKKIK